MQLVAFLSCRRAPGGPSTSCLCPFVFGCSARSSNHAKICINFTCLSTCARRTSLANGCGPLFVRITSLWRLHCFTHVSCFARRIRLEWYPGFAHRPCLARRTCLHLGFYGVQKSQNQLQSKILLFLSNYTIKRKFSGVSAPPPTLQIGNFSAPRSGREPYSLLMRVSVFARAPRRLRGGWYRLNFC